MTCDCCNAPNVQTTEYEHMGAVERFNEPDKRYNACALCAGSWAFNAMCYHYENEMLYKTVCYVGNAVLNELRGNRG